RLTDLDRIARQFDLTYWRRGRLGLIDTTRQAECPDFVTVQRRLPTAVTANGERDVLVGAVGPRHWRSTDGQTGLEPPKNVAARGVVRLDVAVDLAPEDETAGGAQGTVALIARLTLLPDDLVIAAVHGS